MEPLCGGFGGARPVDDNIKAKVAQVKAAAEGKLGKTYATFEPVSYTSQVVNGTNYKVKVNVGENEYVHVKIYEKLPCYGGTLELTEAEGGKTLADAL